MTHNYTKEEMTKNGIYRIYCKENNKSYIGSAACTKSNTKTRIGFNARFLNHQTQLSKNKHRNAYLQNAYNLYGEESFTFEIVEFCHPDDCAEKEIYYMEQYQSMIGENGFNIIKQPLTNYAGNFTQEHKDKISKSLTGRTRPVEDVVKYSKTVLQYDLEGNFIREYYSMSEASRVTGIQRQDIGQQILGNGKTAGGYFWKLKIKT